MTVLRVTMRSGSTYVIDNEHLTWARRNEQPGHEDIFFMEGVHEGFLSAPATPTEGESMFLSMGDEWVRTTPVVSIEKVPA